MKDIVTIENVNKFFHHDQVLADINLTIKNGEFLTLLGPSGCGKTTLLRLISGFEVPTSGDVYINGKNVKGVDPEDRHVNMVFQSYALFPHMSVFENVAFGLCCQNLPKKEINVRVDFALKMVKLEKLKWRKPAQLSGGQQQRVAIARAVVNEPCVLLLDEPMSALDYGLRKNMQIELKNLQRKLGITFVLVTHDQEEALSMSDRVVVMNEGIIEQIGTPRQVYENPKNLYVAKFIGEANIFDTKIEEVNQRFAYATIEGLRCRLRNLGSKLEVGMNVHVIVRPEDIRAWDDKEIENRDKNEFIHAKVEQVIYKGSTVDLLLRTDSGKRLAATEFFDEDDAELDFRRGESVWVEWMHGWEAVVEK